MTDNPDPQPREPVPDALSESERAELDKLRAEYATHPVHDRSTLRWVGTGLLLVLAGLLIVATVPARFVQSEIFDTDHYVATVAPLATDPAIRDEMANKLTDAIVTRVDIEGLTAEAVAALTDNVSQVADRPRVAAALTSLPALVAAQAQTYIRQVAVKLIDSEQFQKAWNTANRLAHQALKAVLTGDTRPGVEVSANGTVSISLQPFLTEVRNRLDEKGFRFADRIPEVDTQFTLFQATRLPAARQAVQALDRSATVLPLLSFAAVLAAVRLAPRGRRLRALALAAWIAVAGMIALGVALLIGRAIYLDTVPTDQLSPDAAEALFDTVIRPLRTAMRAVGVLGLIVAAAAYLAGPSPSAGTVRREFQRGLRALWQRRYERPPNPVEAFTARYRMPLRLIVIAAVVLALLFWPYPTAWVVASLALLAFVLLAAVELIGRRPAEPESS
ncbi:hypothetical protein [Nocardia concava]|uniref:hypothetical protein n=1 Tax=Nocardia concava TaxID=257281 RepID=UPI000306CBDE|nr:hypothetical protein [Nocardia concava]